MGNGLVAAGFCYGQTTVTPQWRRSYTMCVARMLQTRRLIGEFAHEASGVHIPDARCAIVEDFLASPAAPEWLWLTDTDATFADTVVDDLLAVADEHDRPIVGGLAFAVKPRRVDGNDWVNQVGAADLDLFPTLYRLDDQRRMWRLDRYPRDTLVRVDSTGAHCLLIHRRVLADPRWRDGNPLPWFRTAVLDGDKVSEDAFFCIKAAALGYPVHVHTGIRTGHVKTFVADEDHYLRATRPAPATEPVAVIVPVMARPANAAPFMESLRASTGLARVYAIAHHADHATIDAWTVAGAQVDTIDAHPFAVKANHAYRVTDEPWLLLVGDDVVFREGWYDRAVRAAADRYHLVATNDLHNPAVAAGRHATHPLIRRTWVDEHGASWDGPKTVCHEGYRHSYVDNEWTTVAHRADVFTYAADSVVEHRHPIWGGAPDDDTYRRGQAHADQDRRLFERRLRDHTRAA